MIKYDVLYGGDFSDLSKQVNEAINNGWKLQGGVGSYQVHDRDGYNNTFISTWFMQAITTERR